MGEIVFRPHIANPAGMKIETVGPGRNIAELISRYDIPDSTEHLFVAFVNGVQVEREDWSDTSPIDGDHVLIAAVPKGDAGKTILRIAAVAALSYFTFGAGAVFAGTGAGAFAGNTAVFIAGTLAISALFPPPSVDPGDQATSSPSYRITGQRNEIRPFGSAIIIYGRHRVYPPSAAQPYTVARHEAQAQTMLLDCGLGFVEVSEVKIGDTPIEQFNGANWRVVRGKGPEIDFRWYKRDVNTVNVGIDLRQSISHVQTTALATDYCEVEIYLPAGLIWYNSKGKARLHETVVNVQFRKAGDTVWKRFSDAESFQLSSADMKVVTNVNQPGLQPMSPFNLDGLVFAGDGTNTTTRFIGSQFDPTGDDPVSGPGARPLPIGFPEGSTSVRIEPAEDMPVASTFFVNGTLYTITEALVKNVEQNVTISPPLASDFITQPQQYTSSGTWEDVPNYTSGGSIFSVSPSSIEIQNAVTKPLTRVVTIQFPEQDQYEIQVTRFSADESTSPQDSGGVSQTIWSQLRSYSDVPPVSFEHDRTFMELHIRANDQLSGIIDNINFVGRSRIPVYNGVVWITTTTRNPAWIAYNIMTGPGNPTPVPESRMDLTEWLAFAGWCEQNSINSNSIEPQFRFDHVVDYNTTVWELAKSVVASARGIIVQRDGLYSVTWDELPTVPVQLITPQNSWDFSGTRTFPTIPNAIRYRFMDPDKSWILSERTVYDDGYDVNNAVIIDEISLLGITRATQAWRDGRYYLAQAKTRLEEFTFNMDIENLVCTRGDYVQVQHDVPKLGQTSGRITAINGNEISLTEEVIPTGGTDVLVVREVNAAGDAFDMAIYEIAGYDVSGIKVTLLDPPSPNMEVGNLFSQGEMDSAVGDYLVKQIEPGSDFVATVTVTNLAPSVYTFGDGPIPVYNPAIAPNLEVLPPPVTAIGAYQLPLGPYEGPEGGNPFDPTYYEVRFDYINGEPHLSLWLLWAKSDVELTQKYDIYQNNGDRWEKIGETGNNSFFVYKDENILQDGGVNVLIDQPLSFKVIPVSADGLQFPIDHHPIANITLTDGIPLPSAPEGVRLDDSEGKTTISFTPNETDSSVLGFVVKHNWRNDDTATWENSNYVTTWFGKLNDTVTIPSRWGSYLIAAVNYTGDVGPYVRLTTNLNPLSGTVLVGLILGDPTWSNVTLTQNVQIVGSEVRVIDPSQDGIITYNAAIDLGYVMKMRVVSLTESYGDDGGAMSGQFIMQPQIQIASASTVFMSDWVTMSSIDPIGAGTTGEVSNWLNTITRDVSAARINFRIRMRSLDGVTIPVLKSGAAEPIPFFGEFYIAATPRAESGDETFTVNEVRLIEFNRDFFRAPEVNIGIKDNNNAATYNVTSVTRTGFSLDIAMNGEASTSIVWTATGHGEAQNEDIPT